MTAGGTPVDFSIVDPVRDRQWEGLLRTTKDHSFFHTSGWARVLFESYHFKPFYCCRVRGGILQAAIPAMQVKSIVGARKGVSLPFSDFCTPIIADDVSYEDFFRETILLGAQERWTSFEVRGGEPPLPNVQPSETFYGHVLSLSESEKTLFENLHSNNRRNIKRAVKEGVTVSIDVSLVAMREFYRLHCMTRKRHGLPPQPFRFFQKIHEHIIAHGSGFVCIGRWEGKSVAGAVFFIHGREAYFKYGASDRAFKDLRANNLLMWEAIRFLKNKSDSKKLYFGRTDLHHGGLRRFKLEWNTTEYPINYFKYHFRERAIVAGTHTIDGLHTRLFRIMPMPLLKSVGSFLYKYCA